MQVFLGGAQGIGFMVEVLFGEIGRPADRTCDADLSRPKLIEDEAAAEVEEEPPLKLLRVGESEGRAAKLEADEDEGELKWRVGEWNLGRAKVRGSTEALLDLLLESIFLSGRVC